MEKLRKLLIRALAMLIAIIPFVDSQAIYCRSAQAGPPASLPYFTEPAISPDGSEIAFVSAGDIWTVSASGGEARLLVAHPSVESRPIYSPDGKQLALISTRTGGGDIYILSLESGELKRLTFDDANDNLEAWSRDGKRVYFSSASKDIGNMNDLYYVETRGGTPVQVSADRYTNEYFCAPSPDGRSLAFTARGIASSQWWRKGHSHIDESEIWIMRDTPSATYERISSGGAKEMWPMWSADGRSLFYVSDRSGAQNIWTRSLQGHARQVTPFKDGRVLWPTISYDGRTIVFERDFGIWRLNTANGQVARVPIRRRGALTEVVSEQLALGSQIQEFQLSPDGKKIAFAARGEVFAVSAKEGGDATRVTRTPSNEFQIVWAADSNRLAYVSDRGGGLSIYLYDFRTNSESQLTQGTSDYAPRFSPDGKMLAYVRDAREIRVLDLDSKQEALVTKATIERPPFISERSLTWSPDSQWLAYLAVSDKLFKNVYVAPARGGPGQPVSFLTNYGSNTLSWSPDGTFILFHTGQRIEDGRIARIDLKIRTPLFREDQFRDLFKDETPKPAPQTPRIKESPPSDRDNRGEGSSKTQVSGPSEQKNSSSKRPVEVVFDGIRQRISLMPVGVDVAYQTISPDGKSVLMSAFAAGQMNLFIYSLNELSREPAIARQLTTTPGSKRSPQFSPDGKDVYYLEQGRISVVTVESRQARPLAITAGMASDFDQEKFQVFQQAWSYLRDHFFDSNFNGVNWEAVRAAYAPYIAGARTPDELRRLIQLMLGELNASHLGITPPQRNFSSLGRLGLEFDRAEYESRGALKVREVIPFGPAALTFDIKPGDYLIAVDGEQVTAGRNLDEFLADKIGRLVSLTVAGSPEGANRRDLAVQPLNSPTEKFLRYIKWVEDNRAYVSRISGGRLGYVHMYDMSPTSLAQLWIDLDTENRTREGVVIDLRNNTGGFVNVQAIDAFARRGYVTMTPRGLPPGPARTVLGQRALESPTILVVNQHSISDSEEFAEGYRFLNLGKIVGEPTAGWVIYTQSVQLIDGSSLRIPNTKIAASDGSVMEMRPRPVDVEVVRPIGETYTGRDTQLETAVRELLRQLGSRAGASR